MIFFEEFEQSLRERGYTEVDVDEVFPGEDRPSGSCHACNSVVPFFFFKKDGDIRAFYECAGCSSWEEMGIAVEKADDFGLPADRFIASTASRAWSRCSGRGEIAADRETRKYDAALELLDRYIDGENGITQPQKDEVADYFETPFEDIVGIRRREIQMLDDIF